MIYRYPAPRTIRSPICVLDIAPHVITRLHAAGIRSIEQLQARDVFTLPLSEFECHCVNVALARFTPTPPRAA
jgi:hypothetical protein